jgi:hypothetical protein
LVAQLVVVTGTLTAPVVAVEDSKPGQTIVLPVGSVVEFHQISVCIR